MKIAKALLKTNDEIAPLVLRVLLAAVMFPHGAQKLLGWFGGYGFSGTMNFFTQTMHIPAPFALLAITAEFFGPLALVLGLFSRVAAFGISTTITVAAITVALPNGFFMNWFGNQKGEGVEYHILMAAISVAIILQGSGKWALDSLLYSKLSRSNATQNATGKPAVAVAR